MRMRYLPIFIYLGITGYFICLSVADFFFGVGDLKKLGVRLLLAVIWPFAALSSKGRDILFKQGEGL